MASARSTNFILYLRGCLDKTPAPKKLLGLKEQIKLSMAGMKEQELKDLLHQMSDPEYNGLLWQLLEPKVVASLLISELSPAVYRNCSDDQFSAMLDEIPKKEADRVVFTRHKTRYCHMQLDPFKSDDAENEEADAVEDDDEDDSDYEFCIPDPKCDTQGVRRPGTNGK